LTAQSKFILSERTSQPVAMLLDGVWWEHEAKPTFEEMAGEYGADYGYGKRNFKFMPFPKFIGTNGVEDQKNTDTVLYDQNGDSLVCLNAASKQKEGAKLFLRWAHTDENLKKFTLNNGLIRPYNYEFDSNEIKNLAPFARSVWEIWKDESVTIASPAIHVEKLYQETDYIRGMLVSGKDGTKMYNDPFDSFYFDSTLTVAKYLEHMQEKYTAAEWKKYMID
jgi:ABC-type glycerol-3-phosphate transport system substrate-binding protein